MVCDQISNGHRGSSIDPGSAMKVGDMTFRSVPLDRLDRLWKQERERRLVEVGNRNPLRRRDAALFEKGQHLVPAGS